MKINKITLLLVLCFGIFISAQQINVDDYKKLNKKEKMELFVKMNMDEKKALIRQLREKELIKELNLDPSKEKQFSKTFQDYLQSQREIKNLFKRKENFKEMTEQEAKTELENSFVVGQKLMDDRKKYSQEFLKFMSAKQVLQLFHSEMKMREKIESHKHHMKKPEMKDQD